MDEALVARYWCHMCSQMVDPVMEVEIKCPRCNSGFVEEMDDGGGDLEAANMGSDRALSSYAPILLGMMSQRLRREEEDDDDDDDDEDDGSDLDRDLEALLRRRRRRSSIILQLLQALQETTGSESDNSESERVRDRDREGERDRMILINHFNQAINLQGSLDTSETRHQTSNNDGFGASFGDYFLGPSLDILLQHLEENDSNKYGTPPTRKEAIDAMPTVKIKGAMGCSVCLEDLGIGEEAREMPCKHKFHGGCILPWLELHSSCPVCRFRMPAEESKDSNGGADGSRVEVGNEDGGDGGNRRRSWIPVPWPFNGLFSLSGSQNNETYSASPPSSTSAQANLDSGHKFFMTLKISW